MVQRGEDVRLPLEAGESFRVTGDLVGEDLDGDGASQA